MRPISQSSALDLLDLLARAVEAAPEHPIEWTLGYLARACEVPPGGTPIGRVDVGEARPPHSKRDPRREPESR